MKDFDKQMEMVLYHSDEGDVSVDAYIMDDSLWITQKAMAELFGVQVPAISKHLKNIFEDGELEEQVVVSKMEITSPHGAIPGKTQTGEAKYYNLDAIISVGYRVNSKKATQFRIWATKVLKEYMIKGFVLDDDRLKQGKTAFGKDYFRELLERVRSIRASERRIWQQITDIFAECSIDYTKDSEVAYHFYATIQNHLWNRWVCPHTGLHRGFMCRLPEYRIFCMIGGRLQRTHHCGWQSFSACQIGIMAETVS